MYNTYEKIKKFIEENCLIELPGKSYSHKGVYYIYIIEDTTREKFYLGKRTCQQKNLFKEQYFGSGMVIKKIVEKYKENSENIANRLKKYILQISENANCNNIAEIEWISFFDASKNNLFYNITLGGNDGGKGCRRSKETKLKIGETSKGRKHSEKSKLKIGEASKGRKLSDKAKEKVSAAQKGRKCSEETKQKMSDSKKGNKSHLGHHLSDESKQKMSESRKKSNLKKRRLLGLSLLLLLNTNSNYIMTAFDSLSSFIP